MSPVVCTLVREHLLWMSFVPNIWVQHRFGVGLLGPENECPGRLLFGQERKPGVHVVDNHFSKAPLSLSLMPARASPIDAQQLAVWVQAREDSRRASCASKSVLDKTCARGAGANFEPSDRRRRIRGRKSQTIICGFHDGFPKSSPFPVGGREGGDDVVIPRRSALEHRGSSRRASWQGVM
ncbi:hypothetical protein CERZMDRAFT_83214 [Cercospora zeae-maydis SCOH1-5]|uniref:Uncharacterized protein n=1 Tax=Cercospora zeae-maydis SCOH1-5 TaxID=717836 RepID=A0A6A6FMF1_9PEZI|nr:hypothetical protein CERZMDRAFT_83214 [Cercospora zeae-maydis SCOH1-5]